MPEFQRFREKGSVRPTPEVCQDPYEVAEVDHVPGLVTVLLVLSRNPSALKQARASGKNNDNGLQGILKGEVSLYR